MRLADMTPNHALEPTAASALRLLAVPSSLRSSAAAQRERYAAFGAARRILCDGRYLPEAGVGRHRELTDEVTR
jgi:hypothetical protein